MIILKDDNFQLQKGDIFLTRGNAIISSLIRIFSRTGGESRTKVNHVGIMVDSTIAVEALSSVKSHSLFKQYNDGKTKVAVYRPINLSQEEIDAIVRKANSYVNDKYGYVKILAHFGDWMLGGRYFFRRMTSVDKYPICSWLVASAYAAANKNFGCEIGQATPDDIWDFVNANPDKYENVWPL